MGVTAIERLEARTLLVATVGVYDENIVNRNTVDFVAEGSSFTNTQFAKDIEAAFAQDAGGVMNRYIAWAWEFGASQSKTLRLSTAATNYGGGPGFGISEGSSYASTTSETAGYDYTAFDFLGIEQSGQALPDEHIVKIGVTVTSTDYNGAVRDYGIVTVTGRLASGESMSASRRIRELRGLGDTFYGFEAPGGDHFVGFDLRYSGSTATPPVQLRFDDIGFITSAFNPPPPPLPNLTLSVDPGSIVESDGSGAATGIVTRDGDLSEALVVYLSSSDITEATVPATVTIAAGQASASFLINAVDDVDLDGLQSVTITASVGDPVGGPLTFDPSFGAGGVATTSLQMHIQPPHAAVAALPGGKVLAAGQDPHTGSWRITRLNADGSLDTLFGTNGVVTTQFSTGAIHPVPFKILTQPNGQFYVAGKLSAGVGTPALVRYNVDGTLDTAFGNGGFASIAATYAGIEDLVVMSDGKILAAISESGSALFKVTRLWPDGQRDQTFGSNGVRSYSINAAAQTIGLTSSGGFYLAGWETFARFDANGNQLGSPITINFGTIGDVIGSAVLPDGKIVVGFSLWSGNGNSSDFAVARFNANGTLDTTFSGDGWTRTDFNGQEDVATSLAVQKDGRIILAGFTEVAAGVNDVAFVRYTVDGELDSTFDGDGRFTGSLISHNAEQLFDIAINEGRLIVLGGWGTDYRVARYVLPGIGSTATATITVEDDDANTPPVANDLNVTIDEDGSVDTYLTATDTDGDELTFAKLTNPANGIAAVLADGRVRYFPNFNWFGTDTFTYSVTDGTETVTATVTITVNPVNDAPYTGAQGFTTLEDVALNDQLLAIEVEGDPMTFTVEDGPSHGAVIVNADGTFTYTPDPDFSGLYLVDNSTQELIYGSDLFTFRVTDDKGAFRISTAIINITPVDDAPVADDDFMSVLEGGTLTISVAPVTRLVMRSEPGDFIGQGLDYLILGSQANFDSRVNFDNGARVWITGSGIDWDLNFAAPFQALLTPGAYTGATRWPFQASNQPGLDVSGMGRGSNTLTGEFFVYEAIYNIDQSDINSFAARFEQHSEGAIPALRGTIQYNTTVGVHGGLLANDTDADGDFLRTILVSGPSHGTLTLGADGSLVYTPFANYSGTDAFSYRVHDGTLESELATVTINVIAVNNAPVFQEPTYSFALPENSALGTAVGAVKATDADGDEIRYTIVAGNASGAFTIDAVTGNITVGDAALLDFETTPVFDLVVRSTEQTELALFTDVEVTVTLLDVPAPQVTGIRYVIHNSNRTVDAADLTDRTAAWRIDRIAITFDIDVTVGIEHLRVTGSLGGVYSVSSFTYHQASRTAVWTLAAPVSRDRLTILLDGDNASEDGIAGVSNQGEYLGGGDVSLSLDVLYGDISGDRSVTLYDALLQRARNGTDDIWSDLDGDGLVSLFDALLLRSQNGNSLP